MKSAKTLIFPSLLLSLSPMIASTAVAEERPAAARPSSAMHIIGGIDVESGTLRKVSDKEIQVLSTALEKALRGGNSAGSMSMRSNEDKEMVERSIRRRSDGSISVSMPASSMSFLKGWRTTDGRTFISEGSAAPAQASGEVYK